MLSTTSTSPEVTLPVFLRGEVVAHTLVDADAPDVVFSTRWQLHRLGYVRGCFGGKPCYLHRVILSGVAEVDHINENKLDNRRANLRQASRADNIHNVSPPSGNNPHRGVYRRGPNSFRVGIMVGRKQHWVGSFKSLEQAINARTAAEKEHFGEFAPDRKLLCLS